ncbi:MAG: superinfection immunity protein [Pseudolabrys sp.]|jgi:hypothetical protein
MSALGQKRTFQGSEFDLCQGRRLPTQSGINDNNGGKPMSREVNWSLALVLSALLGIAVIVKAVCNIIPAKELALYAYVGLAVGFFLVLYELPAIVAYNHSHRQFFAILVLNILLGWTIVGWIGALIWAYASEVEHQEISIPQRQVRRHPSPAVITRMPETASVSLRYWAVGIVRLKEMAAI